jgi:hypothetical protein
LQISPGIDQIFDTLSTRVLVHHLDQICAGRIDRFIRAERLRELSLALIRIADEQQAFVTYYIAQVLSEQ